MHFANNYYTNGRLHLLRIRRHIRLVEWVGVEVLSSHAGLVFEVLWLMSFAYLSNTVYRLQENMHILEQN